MRGDFTREMVHRLLSERGFENKKNSEGKLGRREWWISDLGQKLGMPASRLRVWILHGWLHGRQTPVQKMWLAWADRDELKRLRKWKTYSKRRVVSFPT